MSDKEDSVSDKISKEFFENLQNSSTLDTPFVIDELSLLHEKLETLRFENVGVQERYQEQQPSCSYIGDVCRTPQHPVTSVVPYFADSKDEEKSLELYNMIHGRMWDGDCSREELIGFIDSCNKAILFAKPRTRHLEKCYRTKAIIAQKLDLEGDVCRCFDIALATNFEMDQYDEKRNTLQCKEVLGQAVGSSYSQDVKNETEPEDSEVCDCMLTATKFVYNPINNEINMVTDQYVCVCRKLATHGSKKRSSSRKIESKVKMVGIELKENEAEIKSPIKNQTTPEKIVSKAEDLKDDPKETKLVRKDSGLSKIPVRGSKTSKQSTSEESHDTPSRTNESITSKSAEKTVSVSRIKSSEKRTKKNLKAKKDDECTKMKSISDIKRECQLSLHRLLSSKEPETEIVDMKRKSDQTDEGSIASSDTSPTKSRKLKKKRSDSFASLSLNIEPALRSESSSRSTKTSSTSIVSSNPQGSPTQISLSSRSSVSPSSKSYFKKLTSPSTSPKKLSSPKKSSSPKKLSSPKKVRSPKSSTESGKSSLFGDFKETISKYLPIRRKESFSAHSDLSLQMESQDIALLKVNEASNEFQTSVEVHECISTVDNADIGSEKCGSSDCDVEVVTDVDTDKITSLSSEIDLSSGSAITDVDIQNITSLSSAKHPSYEGNGLSESLQMASKPDVSEVPVKITVFPDDKEKIKLTAEAGILEIQEKVLEETKSTSSASLSSYNEDSLKENKPLEHENKNPGTSKFNAISNKEFDEVEAKSRAIEEKIVMPIAVTLQSPKIEKFMFEKEKIHADKTSGHIDDKNSVAKVSGVLSDRFEKMEEKEQNSHDRSSRRIMVIEKETESDARRRGHYLTPVELQIKLSSSKITHLEDEVCISKLAHADITDDRIQTLEEQRKIKIKKELENCNTNIIYDIIREITEECFELGGTNEKMRLIFSDFDDDKILLRYITEAQQRIIQYEETNLVYKDVSYDLTEGPNSEIPCISSCVKLVGKKIIATCDILPGSTLYVQEALVASVLESAIVTNCSHCLARCTSMIACHSCTRTMYCSILCKDNAWREYHRTECKLMPLFEEFPDFDFIRFVFRIYYKLSSGGVNLATLGSCMEKCKESNMSPTDVSNELLLFDVEKVLHTLRKDLKHILSTKNCNLINEEENSRHDGHSSGLENEIKKQDIEREFKFLDETTSLEEHKAISGITTDPNKGKTKIINLVSEMESKIRNIINQTEVKSELYKEESRDETVTDSTVKKSKVLNDTNENKELIASDSETMDNVIDSVKNNVEVPDSKELGNKSETEEELIVIQQPETIDISDSKQQDKIEQDEATNIELPINLIVDNQRKDKIEQDKEVDIGLQINLVVGNQQKDKIEQDEKEQDKIEQDKKEEDKIKHDKEVDIGLPINLVGDSQQKDKIEQDKTVNKELLIEVISDSKQQDNTEVNKAEDEELIEKSEDIDETFHKNINEFSSIIQNISEDHFKYIRNLISELTNSNYEIFIRMMGIKLNPDSTSVRGKILEMILLYKLAKQMYLLEHELKYIIPWNKFLNLTYSVMKNIIHRVMYANTPIVNTLLRKPSYSDDPDYELEIQNCKSLFVANAYFDYYNYFKVSCHPNAAFSYCDKNKIKLVSVRNISRGSEITVSHTVEDIFFMKERELRNKWLEHRYKFSCSCEACLKNWEVYAKMPDLISSGYNLDKRDRIFQTLKTLQNSFNIILKKGTFPTNMLFIFEIFFRVCDITIGIKDIYMYKEYAADNHFRVEKCEKVVDELIRCCSKLTVETESCAYFQDKHLRPDILD